jgi:hypothetical protein
VPGEICCQLSWRQVLAWRLTRHHLTHRAKRADLLRVVADIGGLHAQVTSSAELSAWARVDSLGPDDVREALWTHRSLVKLWAARGTLYLLPSAELGLWLAALGTYTKFHNAGDAEIDTLASAVDRALRGRVLTRDELASEVARITGSAIHAEHVRVSWGSYLKAASFRGLICFAPGHGPHVRFTSPATWVPGGIHRQDPADALREITRRFLIGYGPAGPAELTRWWLGPPQPRRGAQLISALGEEAVRVGVAGQPAWALAADVREMESAPELDVSRLLPAFDPWVIGAARVAPLLDPAHRHRVFRPQGWISPVLLVDGQIAGVWQHTRKGRRVQVELEPFGKLAARAYSQLEAEAERLAAFLSCELSLRWQPAGDSPPGRLA